MQFLGSVSIQRDILLKGGTGAFKAFIENFLQVTRFNTKWGVQKLNETLLRNNLQNNNQSLLQYLEKHTLPMITLAAFQVDNDDYEFRIIHSYNYDGMMAQVRIIEQEDVLTPIGKEKI